MFREFQTEGPVMTYGCRFVHRWHGGRTQMACSILRSDVAVEIDRRGGAAYFVGQYDQLVVDSLVD